MAFVLPELPYARNALAPHISEETVNYHYGKHHQGYVNKLNEVSKGTDNEKKSLDELVRTSTGSIYNLSAQIVNHTFYWNSLSPNGGGEPKGQIAEAINKRWGNFGEFKKEFSQVAAGHFGSGWAWLVKDSENNLKVVGGHDAHNPTTDGLVPILTCDVWEHAYYVDYRNDRVKYIEAWWSLVNWDFANKNFESSKL